MLTGPRLTAPVLYLDLDGVAHDDDVYWSQTRGVYMRDKQRYLFEYLPPLVEALEPFPAAQIVLSTSWVRQLGFWRTVCCLRHHAGEAFAARIIGATYHSQHTPHWDAQTRYAQIRADVARRLLKECWLALDNDSQGWPSHMRWHLVDTQDCGLRPIDVERLVARLGVLVEHGGPAR